MFVSAHALLGASLFIVGCDGTPPCGRAELPPEWRDRGVSTDDEVQICSASASDVRLMYRMPHANSNLRSVDDATGYQMARLFRSGYEEQSLQGRPGSSFVRTRGGRTERVFIKVWRENELKRGDVILVTLHAQFD
jgi:hypothetical protein